MTLPATISAAAALIAAGCWFRSASIKVPNNQDTFIEVLQHAGSWNRAAAGAAGVAAIFQGIATLSAT